MLAGVGVVGSVVANVAVAAPAAAATPTPAAPTVIYTEDFENGLSGNDTPESLAAYTSATTGTNGSALTYTADPAYLDTNCNGVIA
ncbi:MAG: hypothetical protein ACRENM_06570, partial [Candidatus Dormibacteraceae bacterium]